MVKLKRTLLIIFTLIITTQTFRHVYVKFIEPTDSVLTKYSDKTEKNVYASKSIEELEKLYKKADSKVKKYEKAHKPTASHYKRKHREPYKSKLQIREAIESTESINKRLFELKFYWFCGLLALVIGLIVYLKINKWMGVSSIIIGISEIAIWTSPLFRGYGRRIGFENLLNYKLIFSIASFLIMITLWYLSEKVEKQKG